VGPYALRYITALLAHTFLFYFILVKKNPSPAASTSPLSPSTLFTDRPNQAVLFHGEKRASGNILLFGARGQRLLLRFVSYGGFYVMRYGTRVLVCVIWCQMSSRICTGVLDDMLPS
jgi:hypothetical protein